MKRIEKQAPELIPNTQENIFIRELFVGKDLKRNLC